MYPHLSIREHAKEGAMRVGIRLVKIAAIYLLIGVGLGLAMGIS